jgi:bifunctional non-homologous end joining protein LigD
MGLTEYRRKRDFSRTREPRGSRLKAHKALSFVVQKHAASHLHYDFRLEIDGVLKSWAVPKGPDLNPATKRLAMHVEDHPVEYGGFEGIIPEGEYGGGTVMIWDRGTWQPREDPRKGYRDGRLKFDLHGEKLRGGWMLVRRGGKSRDASAREWFLFKERDTFADGKRPITQRLPLSVLTERDLDEIATEADRIWGPKGEMKRKSRGTKAKARAVKKPRLARDRTSRGKNVDRDVVAGVKLSHPEKVLYPEEGLTKRDLAEYYKEVAEWMLPWVKDRPLALVRCPAGHTKPCFFQKHPSEGGGAHLRPVNISETRTAEYNWSVRDRAGLVELAQMGVLEIHVWGSHARSIEKPDWLVFDLDPDEAVGWAEVVKAAREVRLLLEELGLVSFVKTTGGKGLHVVVPVQARTEWDRAKAFAKAVAELMVNVAPDRYVATMSKAARKGKIFIDYLRNGRGATAIAPYSTRARPGATISVPISWDELAPSLRGDHFRMSNIAARLAQLRNDPWRDMAKTRQSLTKAMFRRLGV